MLTRPEMLCLDLDDAAEVLSITCTPQGQMTVSSLHPLAIEKGMTVLEAAKEWGCMLNQDAKSPHAVVAIVNEVSSSVQPSGVIEYTLQLEETAPLAGAAVWDSSSFISVQPPSAEQRESVRRLISCSDSIAAAQGSGFYMTVDCTTTGDSGFGEFDFNYDRSRQAPVQSRMPIPGLSGVWFDETFASFTAAFELKMAAYATTSGVDLPFFEAKLTANARASITLKATESSQTSSSWSDLTSAISSGSFVVQIGPLPVLGEATAQLVARKPASTLSSITASVGASMSARAEFGVRYSNRLMNGQGCYCVSACSSTFTFPQNYCFLNEGCTSSSVQSSRDGSFKWALCSSFNRINTGWALITDGSWDFQGQAPTVTSETGVPTGSSTYELGSRLGLTLYRLVPLIMTPSHQVVIKVTPGNRALRQEAHGHGRALCSSQASISGEAGKTNLETGIGAIAFSLPVFGRTTLLNGRTFAPTEVASTPVSTAPFPICNADSTIGTAPAATGSGQRAGADSDGEGGISTTIIYAVVAVVAVALIVGVVLFVRKRDKTTTQARAVEAPVTTNAAKTPSTPPAAGAASAPIAQSS